MEKSKTAQKSIVILREFSSGGVVYKKTADGVLWLITRSVPSEKYVKVVWRLPKGWLDDENELPGPIARGERKATENELKETALREVAEEGGVEGKIISKVGTEIFSFTSSLRGGKVLKFVTFYLMEWQKDLEGSFGEETSEILWLNYTDARKRLTQTGEKKILNKAFNLLNTGE